MEYFKLFFVCSHSQSTLELSILTLISWMGELAKNPIPRIHATFGDHLKLFDQRAE